MKNKQKVILTQEVPKASFMKETIYSMFNKMFIKVVTQDKSCKSSVKTKKNIRNGNWCCQFKNVNHFITGSDWKKRWNLSMDMVVAILRNCKLK